MCLARAGGNSMKQKDNEYFKDVLTQWLNDLLRQADNTVVSLTNADYYSADPLDRAISQNECDYTIRIRDRESNLIRKIKASLEDIEDDVYGICEDCGRDIAIERLKARPVAKRCIRCKTRQEESERSVNMM
jgi:RNA polymerase-binding transcription factor